MAGKKVLEQLSRRYYFSAKAYGIFDLYLSNLKGKEPIIVYQMGKVGSTTILRSLRALKLGMGVYHVHVLSQSGIARVEKIYKENFAYKRRIDGHLLASYYLRKQLDKGLHGKKWKVITLVREPIARNLSSFFEVLNLQYARYEYHNKIDFMSLETIVEELIELFFREFEHNIPLIWFDQELNQVLDIDVFAADFPKEKGYKIFQGEQADVLLLRLESLNECATEAMRAFLNIDEFSIIKGNVASHKYYSSAYRRLKDAITIPESYIEKMYSSKYVRHFYSEEEIDTFKARWRTQKLLLETAGRTKNDY